MDISTNIYFCRVYLERPRNIVLDQKYDTDQENVMSAPESVWSLSVEQAFEGIPQVSLGIVSDGGGQRFLVGTQEDFEDLTALSEFNDFLTTIGFGAGALTPADRPSDLNDYTFRFQAIATGSILVLGGDKELASEVITNDLVGVLAELNLDDGFTKFMNTISVPGTILVLDSTDISFAQIIGNDTIASASGTPFADLIAGDQIEILGSESNDGTFTISSVELSGARVIVSQTVTTEIAGAEITIFKLP